MLILTADDVRQALPMRDAIEAMKSAYASLSDGRAVAPLRLATGVGAAVGLSPPRVEAMGQSHRVDAVSHDDVAAARALGTQLTNLEK